MKILITGGAGYLGAHLANIASKNGNEILIIDDFSSSNKNTVEQFNYAQADITNFEDIDEIFARYHPDTVMHLAALSNIPICQENPELCKKINVTGTKNILDAMTKNATQNIIFASSAAVYANSHEALSESSELAENSEYGKSKIAGEKLISEYENINHVILRIFNLAGADPEGKFGEDHMPESHLIPLVIQAAFAKKEISIFGNDYDTDDGTAVRDYIHVCDVADAFLLAGKYLMGSGKSETFNVASGNAISVKRIIEEVKQKLVREVDCKILPRRKGDVARLLASIEKIKTNLNWQPKLSKIDNIIDTAVNWHSKQL